MLSKTQKRTLRSDIFCHLDGLATSSTAFVLFEKGVLDYLLEKKNAFLSEIAADFDANEGYLGVALRVLCSQGWLDHSVDNAKDLVVFSINEKSKVAFEHCILYKEVYELLKESGKYHPRLFRKEPFQQLELLLEKFKLNFNIEFSKDKRVLSIQKQILKHLEGALIAPSIVALGMNGMFHKYFMEASFRPDEFHEDVESFSSLLNFFAYLEWFTQKNGTYSFTDKGLFFAKRASAYGVTVSYQPTFRHLDQLIFGDPNYLWNVPNGQPEKHVDRAMNVWGSGGAHGAYFKKIDEIIISLFDKPIDQQPRGIVDMGCGNGAYLQHLYEVIEQRTYRGTILEEYPLFLVGADYNKAALRATRANLIKADIWAKVIWGDIGRPDLLAKDLRDNYKIDIKNLLSVRTFLDHNRIWEEPETYASKKTINSTGLFCFRGRRLSNNLVENNLREHFLKWAPYVEKFGLLIIELHTLPPDLAAKNLGKTAVTAYDATHGYSDQYIVEVDVMKEITKEAGLFPVEKYFSKFPNSDLATISINLLKGR